MTKEQRHKCMSSIRGKNTRPEMIVRSYLFSHGLRYRIHVKKLPGTPDIVLRKYMCVIFVNGCFWHGHDGCGEFRPPKSNTAFWSEKIRRNKERDARVRVSLRLMGWHVIQLWECQLKSSVRQSTLESLLFTLNHIYLSDRTVRANMTYAEQEEHIYAAAEPQGGYTKK
jgi:DNA mismatch endonuclease (patch repair protein)